MHPALAIMLHAAPHGGGDESEPDAHDEEGVGDEEGKKAAVKALFKAIEEGDVEKGVKCLEMFCDMHSSPGEEGEEDGEQEGKY